MPMTRYEHARQEPPLFEVMNDPIVKMLMHYDGVRKRDLPLEEKRWIASGGTLPGQKIRAMRNLKSA